MNVLCGSDTTDNYSKILNLRDVVYNFEKNTNPARIRVSFLQKAQQNVVNRLVKIYVLISMATNNKNWATAYIF